MTASRSSDARRAPTIENPAAVNATPHNALADAVEQAEMLAWLLNHAHVSKDLRGNVGGGNNPGP